MTHNPLPHCQRLVARIDSIRIALHEAPDAEQQELQETYQLGLRLLLSKLGLLRLADDEAILPPNEHQFFHDLARVFHRYEHDEDLPPAVTVSLGVVSCLMFAHFSGPVALELFYRTVSEVTDVIQKLNRCVELLRDPTV